MSGETKREDIFDPIAGIAKHSCNNPKRYMKLSLLKMRMVTDSDY